MAKYDKLPDEDHLVRHVPYGRLRKDGNGDTIGVLAQAFELRDGETYLSASWLEYLPGSRQEQLVEILRCIRKSRTAGAKSGLTIGNVGHIKQACLPTKIRVTHHPEPDNPAHAAVWQFPSQELELLETLAAETWSELLIVGELDNANIESGPP